MITRFDSTELKILNCANGGGGYYPRGVEKERALLLMEEGILVNIPENRWHIRGYTFTDFGREYCREFLEKVKEKHGHIWKTNHESNPDLYDKGDSYGDQIDNFGLDVGYHNGPICKNCGFSFCHHCQTELDIEECPNK